MTTSFILVIYLLLVVFFTGQWLLKFLKETLQTAFILAVLTLLLSLIFAVFLGLGPIELWAEIQRLLQQGFQEFLY